VFSCVIGGMTDSTRSEAWWDMARFRLQNKAGSAGLPVMQGIFS